MRERFKHVHERLHCHVKRQIKQSQIYKENQLFIPFCVIIE